LQYTGRVALITGGSKGIGEGCARVFVDAGAKVMICARGAETGRALAEELSAKGPGTCQFEKCDVSRPDDIVEVVARTVRLHGRLDCLINNAGYHPPHKTIDEFTLAELEDVFRTNFVSYFVACKTTLPHLRQTKGNIINIGSLVSAMGQEAATIYCATKGAIGAFTKSLAIEESRNEVRVNSVLPGNILSDSRRAAGEALPDGEAFHRLVDSWQATGRSGTNEEVGQLCLFLASDAASYITGVEVIISGGSELGYGIKHPLFFIDRTCETEART
jgi:L-fucose dehydrogenase